MVLLGDGKILRLSRNFKLQIILVETDDCRSLQLKPDFSQARYYPRLRRNTKCSLSKTINVIFQVSALHTVAPTDDLCGKCAIRQGGAPVAGGKFQTGRWLQLGLR